MYRRQFTFLGLLLLISLVVSSSLVWRFERPANETLETWGDIFWWWLVTSSTVGYGDIAPATLGGRIGGVVAILVGIFCYTAVIAVVSDQVRESLNRNRLGTARVSARGHILICEYTAFADELIQALPGHPELAKREVVILTDLVAQNPYPKHRFVRGVPISPASLKQANVDQADLIFVFSNIRFKDPDLKTLHVVSRIQRLNQHARTFVELENPEIEFRRHLRREVTAFSTQSLLEAVIRDEGLNLDRMLSDSSREPTSQGSGLKPEDRAG